MVWFQCEDCGENLKKPKLANHFRICSAHKLSCIDCGVFFSKESVQTHTQCMTEAEKYGPKDHGKPSQNSNSKPEKPKKNADVDITVGLSLRPPWFCSLCNTPTTSKQTLLLHADGKKHRAKARAFLAAQKQSNQTEVAQDNEKESAFASPKLEPVKVNDMVLVGARQVHEKKSHEKRKHDEVGGTIVNGEVIRAAEEGGKSRSKKNKIAEMLPSSNNHHIDDGGVTLKKKIKWKKLIVSTLASKPAGAMKINKLQKLVIRNLEASGIAGDEGRLCDAMMEKINSSSRFIINGELICLAAKTNN